MRSLKCSKWLGLLERSWFYFPSEYTTAFSSIKMQTFNLGPVGGCECTLFPPSWLRAWIYYHDIQVEIERYKFVLLFIHFDREYWGFSDKLNMQKPRPYQESGVCNISYARYLEKPLTQIYKALYGDTMFVSLWGAQIRLQETNRNISVFLSFPTNVWINCLKNS